MMTDDKNNHDSSNIGLDHAKALLQKAIDLRIFKNNPENNLNIGGFEPRFLEVMLTRVDEGRAFVDNQTEMYASILEYWNEISGDDGTQRLFDVARKDTQDFRYMCDILVRIMDRVHSKKEKERHDQSKNL